MMRVVGTLREGISEFMIISRSVLLKMRNDLDKICIENKNTRFMSNKGFLKKNRVGCEKMEKK